MENSRPPRTKGEISDIMRKVRSQDTTPEVSFRDALIACGLQIDVYSRELPGKPDVIVAASSLVVFIDGDYWHGNQWRLRGLTGLEEQFRRSKPESRRYWLSKIRRNMQRDCVSTSKLLAQGWTVLRFWESDIRKDVGGCVSKVLDVVNNGVQPSLFSFLPERTFAEFFAGIGLMRMGLERQGWTIRFANDIDVQKYEMYKAHFGDVDSHFTLGDVHALSASAVPTVTLATASFPCNDLSLAGARQGLKGSQSSAFWGFMRILEEMGNRRPPLVLIENVTGFLSSHGGKDFKEAMLALNDLGYGVDPFILDASRFVPHSRPRLFVVGVLEDSTTSKVVREQPRLFESDVRPAALANFILTHPEIRWRIQDLPAQPPVQNKLPDILDSPEESEWWGPERAEYLLNQMSPRHREIADRMIAGSDWSYGTVFRRVRNNKSMAELRTDGIAGCLRTPRGGSGRQILFKAGKGQYFARLLSARECARLMGADDFKIDAPLNQALFGFGDAVCVPVIEWIATYYLNPIVNELIRGRALAPLTGY